MSTRTEREKLQKLNERHNKILQELLRKDYNRTCADCPQRSPRWASHSLGVFVCIDCSGHHRNLGVHISKVKSTNLDTWNPAEVEKMINMGNRRANEYWEANLPSNYQKVNGPQAGSFIRKKYVDKKFVASGPPPDPTVPGVGELPPPPRAPAVTATSQATDSMSVTESLFAAPQKQRNQERQSQAPMTDLLGMGSSMQVAPQPATTSRAAGAGDLFAVNVAAPGSSGASGLDLLGGGGTAPHHPQQRLQQQSKSNGDFADFGDFNSAAAVDGKQKTKTDDIMSLFETPVGQTPQGGVTHTGMMMQSGMMTHTGMMMQSGMMAQNGMMMQSGMMAQNGMYGQTYAQMNGQQMQMNGLHRPSQQMSGAHNLYGMTQMDPKKQPKPQQQQVSTLNDSLWK